MTTASDIIGLRGKPKPKPKPKIGKGPTRKLQDAEGKAARAFEERNDPPAPMQGTRSPGISDTFGTAPTRGASVAPNAPPAGTPGPQLAAPGSLDQYLASIGLQAPGAQPLIDIGSSIASYNQAREAARQNAGMAQTQIGQYGDAAKAQLDVTGQEGGAASLVNIANVRATGKQMASQPDENTLRALQVAQANGITLSPGVLEDAARQKGVNQMLGGQADQMAVAEAARGTRGHAQAVESSAMATQSGRTSTQANLNNLLAQIGVQQSETTNQNLRDNAAIGASNASAQNAYAIQRAEAAQNFNPDTGKAYTADEIARQSQKTESDPYTDVMNRLTLHDQQSQQRNFKSVNGTMKMPDGSPGGGGPDGTFIVREAISAAQEAGGDVAGALSLVRPWADSINAERKKQGLSELSWRWISQMVSDAFRTSTTTTTSNR